MSRATLCKHRLYYTVSAAYLYLHSAFTADLRQAQTVSLLTAARAYRLLRFAHNPSHANSGCQHSSKVWRTTPTLIPGRQNNKALTNVREKSQTRLHARLRRLHDCGLPAMHTALLSKLSMVPSKQIGNPQLPLTPIQTRSETAQSSRLPAHTQTAPLRHYPLQPATRSNKQVRGLAGTLVCM